MFEIKENFYDDGKKVQLISGSIHYFRIPCEYWRDRLEKLVNMGCNCVETYIPWNFHETEKGVFNWSGMHDVERFISIAEELDLYVIIRPSPFICAEWEWGGLPAWLLKDRNMKVRTMYGPFLESVTEYFKVLMPKLASHQADRGGKIIMMQIENEYGYFGHDKKYLQFYADLMRSLGITVPFVTSDGPWGLAMWRGKMKDVLPTGNFGSKVKKQFRAMRRRIGRKWPLMVMEFWCGWFDAWNGEHHTSDIEQNKKDLDEIMRTGNVNFYMFEGGTNFGFMNGRNNTTFYGDITSYDYDGILTQDGRTTPKYDAFRKIIGSYKKIPEIPLTTKIEYASYGELTAIRKTGLFSTLGKITSERTSENALSMEETGQNYGYIIYSVDSDNAGKVQFTGAGDRIQIFEDGKASSVAFGRNLNEEIRLSGKNKELTFLAENMGRVNFGKAISNQRKGIFGNIKIDGTEKKDYRIRNLPLDEKQISKIDWNAGFDENLPAFWEFEFTADKKCDTFLNFEGFKKGCAFINGINLGRYWNAGPQKKLYIPAPFLNEGKNTIILFDTEGCCSGKITLDEKDSW